eukprot:10536930-Alexandrium_andersonii.AAC.1
MPHYALGSQSGREQTISNMLQHCLLRPQCRWIGDGRVLCAAALAGPGRHFVSHSVYPTWQT